MEVAKKRKRHRTTIYKRNKIIFEQLLQFNPRCFNSESLLKTLLYAEDTESESDESQSAVSPHRGVNLIQGIENTMSPSQTSLTSNLNIQHSDVIGDYRDEIINLEDTNRITDRSSSNGLIDDTDDDGDSDDDDDDNDSDDDSNNDDDDSDDDSDNECHNVNTTSLFQNHVLDIPVLPSGIIGLMKQLWMFVN
ncbi:coiled-coil domain-containing protein 1-like isoform X2 [Microplitis mediator]|uniref:coiled-coil domain-containing protein 1-like isoform X2 n=1 Tax=Microplitis mediator TaxID=375433 RepID=UPI0025557A04|nr:coiled-coil domain-containing protein 1-like isoform X2 [Microplitis mediator]